MLSKAQNIIRNTTKASAKAVLFVLVVLIATAQLFVFSIHSAEAAPALNYLINYQGKLLDSSGAPVPDGTYDIDFRLYDSNPSEIWAESDSVTVTDGLFSVMLGQNSTLEFVDFNQSGITLGIDVEGDGEMTPRKEIGMVPAAFVADKLDGISSEQFLRSDAPNVVSISNASTFLQVTQNGAGKIADFIGQSFAPVFNVGSDGIVNVGTSTGYARFNVWGASDTAGQLANFVNNASTSVLTILNNGKVGIGTTTPGYDLTVSNPNGGAQFSLYDSTELVNLTMVNTGANMQIGFGGTVGTSIIESDGTYLSYLAPDTQYWLTGGTQRMFLGSDGNLNIGSESLAGSKLSVGGNAVIGDTWNGLAGPTNGLLVEGNVSIGEIIPLGNKLTVSGNAVFGSGFDQTAAPTNGLLVQGNVGIGTTTPYARLSVWGSGSSSDTRALEVVNSASTTLMLINDAGYVGIGTTSPSVRLAISDFSPALELYDESEGVLMSLSNSGGFGSLTYGSGSMIESDGGSYTALYAPGGTSGSLFLGTNSLIRATVDGNGNFGIGTTSPFAKLSVAGSAYIGGNLTATGTLTVGTLSGILQATNGVVSTLPSITVANGGTGASSFGQGWIYSTGGTSALAASTSPTVNYLTSTSTSATSTFAYDVGVTGRLQVLQSGTLATIIGNTSGAARGNGALDVQSNRLSASQVASGANGIAVGISNTAGDDAMAIGNSNSADANGVAIGNSNITTGFLGLALGRGNVSGATLGVTAALGYNNTSSGASSAAFGLTNTVTGPTSSAFGQNNIVGGDTGNAFGYRNFASVLNSVSVGNRNFSGTGGLGAVAMGFMNNQTGGTLNLSTAAVTGTATGSATIGKLSSSVGIRNLVSGDFGQAFGFFNTVSVSGSSAFGSYITNSLASSTQIGSGDTSKIVIRGDTGFEGFTGIGSTTPYAKLTVLNDSTTLPQLFVGTSTIGTVAPLLYVGATTTGAMDWARVGIGTTANAGAAGLRDQLVVSGRIYSTWKELRCDTLGASQTAGGTADTRDVCGPFVLDSDNSDGGIQPNTDQYGSIRAGQNTATANEAADLRTWTKITTVANNPVLETMVKIPSAQTGTLYSVGFTSKTANVGLIVNPPTDGIYFIASTTNNWIASVRVGGVQKLYADTGVATSTSFQKMRIEVTADNALFLINDVVVAEVTGSANLPSTSTYMAPSLAVGVLVTGGSVRLLDVTYLRVWVDDPPAGVSGEGLRDSGQSPDSLVSSNYDGISGANIALQYIGGSDELEQGDLVSISDEGGLKIEKTPVYNDRNMIGVISYSYRELYGEEDVKVMPVAFSGRALVKVTAENGPITIGDPITSSNIAGVGMKAKASGYIVGRALENYTNEEEIGSILVEINPQYYMGDTFYVNETGAVHANAFVINNPNISGLPTEALTAAGSVDLLKLSASMFTDVHSLTEKFAALEAKIASSTAVLSVDSMRLAFEKLGAKISDGFAFFKNLVVETFTVGSSEKPSGITLFDEKTGEPYCVKVSGGKLKNYKGACEENDTKEIEDNSNDSDSPSIATSTPVVVEPIIEPVSVENIHEAEPEVKEAVEEKVDQAKQDIEEKGSEPVSESHSEPESSPEPETVPKSE